MMPMARIGADRRIQRPWSALTAAVTAAHHGFELSNGIGLVWQPELGLGGASAMWGTQIPLWITLAAKGSKRWDKLLAQAGQIKYITESNGKIRIETRRDRIARQKRSPEAWAHTKGPRSHAIDRPAGRRIPPRNSLRPS